MRSLTAFIGAVLLVLFTVACASSTAPQQVSEVWQYNGSQRIPNVLQLDGVLVVTRRYGDKFEGSLDVRRTDALGQAERVRGLVLGRRGDGTLEFEATLDGVVIRHVGRAEGNSVSGTWLDDGTFGGSLVSGAFRLVRQP